MKIGLILLTAWLGCQTVTARCQAYRPESDAEVLEILPVKVGEKQKIISLQAQFRHAPNDYAIALELARGYMEQGRRHADPRYYGYAEAVLAEWLKPGSPKPEALVLKATLLQNRHDFKAALSDLSEAIGMDAKMPQAWLTKAAIYEATGQYPEAIRSCLALMRLSDTLASSVCLHSALSLSGQAEPSYRQLSMIVGNDGSPEILTWAYTVLAELAERLNRPGEAENWYRKALSQKFRSVYLLTSYADFLLDRNLPGRVVNLLKDEIDSDALLLRLTLAEIRLHQKAYQAHVEAIKARIDAARLRGDKTHEGDEARFNLSVLNDPGAALALAQSNWAVQKEPRDARILLETALAAKQPEAALPVLDFFDRTHLEDHRLHALLKLLKG